MNLALIVSTKLDHIFSFNFSIRNIDVVFRDVDVVEKVMVHVVIVALRVIVPNWIVFVQVERDHVLEAQLTLFMHSHQFTVHTNRSAPCGQPQHKRFSSGVLLQNGISNDCCDCLRGLAGCGEEVGRDLFDEREAGELGKVIAGLTHWHTLVELQHCLI